MTLRCRIGCVVVLTAILCVPVAASGEPSYLPLSEGRTWRYEASGGTGETWTVTGTRELLGNTVYIIDYSESALNDSLQNYWTNEPDGDVLLWGFFREEQGGWGRAYIPPLRWVDAPVYVGQTWACTSQVYSLPDGTPEEVITPVYTVTWEGLLSVPAGDFWAVAIGRVSAGPEDDIDSPVSLDGRMTGLRPTPTRWLSAGVGYVQYQTGPVYQLVSYGVTPVQPASWTRIKQLYR